MCGIPGVTVHTAHIPLPESTEMQDRSDIPSHHRTEQFLGLLMGSQRRIHGYILALVPNRHDSEDLLQETIVAMWRKFDQFEPGTDFVAWSLAIARLEVLRYRQRFARSRLMFNDELLDQIARDTEQSMSNLDRWGDALADCLQRLSGRDRDHIRLKYEQNLTVKAVAQRVGRPVQGMYKAMARIHAALSICAKRKLKEADS